MQAKEYAQALFDLALEKRVSESVLIQNLLSLLKVRGHEKLLPRVEKEYERLMVSAKNKGITVRAAGEESRKDALHKAHALSEEFGVDPSTIRVVEDDTLIKGYSIEGPGFRYDSSARAALLGLYKQLTTNH